MKILTCNIRCFGAQDGPNDWVHRRQLCVDVIRSQSPSIICFQEMWSQQFIDLTAAFPEYSYFAMVDEPTGQHPQNCIFFNTAAYRLISAGGYWLSQSPHIPGSKSWESYCVRLTNWVRLEELTTGVEFRVVNTHLDHISQAARQNQARLIVEDAAAYPPEYAQILAGDMNCDFRNPAIEIFKTGGWIDTYAAVHGTEDPGFTYHEFVGPGFVSDIGKMDWIFMRGSLKAQQAEVIRHSRDGKFPSDHYFVSATLNLRQKGLS
jgi:endonuclease/exonuclease/phosphatase family metal-dependent hydrolase